MSSNVEHRPICVLTVGRSGSSLAARALALLGADLGPEGEMLPADRHNKAGYWELREMNHLGDELLAALGGNLWAPPALPDGWEQDPKVEPFRRRARELVERLRPTGRRWAFKDARSVYLLPLWRDILGAMDYVICVRAPADFAESLSRLVPERSREEIFGLYVRANAAALRQTTAQPRLILHYDEWSTDPDGVARRLGEFVGVTVDDEALRRVRAAFDASLRHQRADSDDVPIEASAMDAVLRVLSKRDDPTLESLAGRLDTSYARRSERELAASGAVARAEARADDASRDAASLRAERDELRRHRDDLDARTVALSADNDELRARLASIEGSATWRFAAPLRALRHGRPRLAVSEVRTLLGRK
jgi:hypothetical protein